MNFFWFLGIQNSVEVVNIIFKEPGRFVIEVTNGKQQLRMVSVLSNRFYTDEGRLESNGIHFVQMFKGDRFPAQLQSRQNVISNVVSANNHLAHRFDALDQRVEDLEMSRKSKKTKVSLNELESAAKPSEASSDEQPKPAKQPAPKTVYFDEDVLGNAVSHEGFEFELSIHNFQLNGCTDKIGGVKQLKKGVRVTYQKQYDPRAATSIMYFKSMQSALEWRAKYQAMRDESRNSTKKRRAPDADADEDIVSQNKHIKVEKNEMEHHEMTPSTRCSTPAHSHFDFY